MTALTGHDRAKRAKMVARYNSIKQKSASGDVGACPSVPNSHPKPEAEDDRDDDLPSTTISASGSTLRDTAPTESNDADDTIMDAQNKSQASQHAAARDRSTQIAVAKKKLAASRKAVSPVKNEYNYKPIAETQKSVAVDVQKLVSARPGEVNEPFTPPRVVSKRAEMARKLAASRVATSSPQPKTQKTEKLVVKNSQHVKSNASASTAQDLGDAALVKKQSQLTRTENMDQFAAKKASTSRANELARLRDRSPTIVAAAKVKTIAVQQPKMDHSNSYESADGNFESDEDESTLYHEYSAKDAVIQKRELFRKNQEKKNPKAVSDSSSFQPRVKKQSQLTRTENMDQFAAKKASTSRENELARLRDRSPTIVAAAKVKTIAVQQPKMDHSNSYESADGNFESDEDESTLYHEYSAKDAVIQKKELFRKNQEKKNPKAVSDSSSFQPRHLMPDHFGHSFPNILVSMSDSFSDPPLPSMSPSSSREPERRKNEIVPRPPPFTQSVKVSQDFGEGFGFSDEDFSHASWGLGPAFSSEIITNGDADWSRPVNCTVEQKASTSAVWASSCDSKVPKDEDEVAVGEEDKENDDAILNASRQDCEVSPSASAQYVDFGVRNSRGGSVDCNSFIDEEEELDKSILSEETTASATEFDPLSIFGGSGDVSQEIEPSDHNGQSKVSLAIPKEEISANYSSDQTRSIVSSFSQKLTRAEEDSNSISFPSLNSGSLMKPPKPAQQLPSLSTKAPPPPAKNVVRPPPDSPSGTESLESWWQSRYASSQNNDINAAVQEALLNEASSVSKKSQAVSSKNMSGLSTLSSNLRVVRSKEQISSDVINEEESCSIFSGISGIDEDAPTDAEYQVAVAQKRFGSTKQNRNDSAETEEEDLSGVSVNKAKGLQGEAMQSVIDGSSRFTLKRANAGSHSMLYGNSSVGLSPYVQSNVMNSLADGISMTSFSTPIQNANAVSQNMQESKETISTSLSENNYGVIELKNNEKTSPANSHTSDITSSVVFGFDPPTRAAHKRYERVHGHERILETNESEESDGIKSRDVSITGKSEQVDGEKTKMNTANRGVSLIAPSTFDSISQGSSDQKQTGLSGLRDKAKAAILSRFSCGFLNASSFALCAADGGNTQASSRLDSVSSDTDNPSESRDDDYQSYDDDDDNDSWQANEVSSKKETPPTQLTPHTIRLRESSFVKGGVEVMSEAAPKASSSIAAQNELPVYKSASEAQKDAHETLLLYAYTALSVSPPVNFVEKGEKAETNPIIYPSIDGGVKEMGIMMFRFRREGVAVLKLNTHNQWQPRVLTVTKEIHVFNETDDVRYKGIGSCPKGLLWLKKFSNSEQSVTSIIGKKGKGGLFFNTIESVSVTKGIHPLSKKQQKGDFKDSFTFILHSNDNGLKREICFRVANKDDVVLLSAGIQAVIDRTKHDEQIKSKSVKLTVDTLSGANAAPGQSSPHSPILSTTKAFNVAKKAVANPISDDRWEV